MARSLRPGRGFELFGETLLVGLLVAVGSLGVITAVPSVAAGVAHLRRHVAAGETRVARFASDWWSAVRDLWAPGLLLPLAAVVGLVNTALTETGALPGAGPVRVVTWLAVVTAAVVVLRMAGSWSDAEGETTYEGRPGEVLSRGRGRAWREARGTSAGWLPARQHLSRAARTARAARAAARTARDDLTGSVLLVVAMGLAATLVWMLLPLVVITGGLICLAVVGVEARLRERPAAE